MTTFYALFASGSSYTFANGIGSGFQGMNGFMETEAENRVQAFLKIYRQLSKNNSDITVLKTDYQDFILGFSAEELDEISKENIHIKEGYPEKKGVQIQAIRDTPFN